MSTSIYSVVWPIGFQKNQVVIATMLLLVCRLITIHTKSLQHTLLWVTWSSCMIHWLFIHTNTTQAVSYRYKFKVLWSVKLTSLSLAHILAFLKIDSPPILTLMMKNDFIAIFWFIISFNILYYYIIFCDFISKI